MEYCNRWNWWEEDFKDTPREECLKEAVELKTNIVKDDNDYGQGGLYENSRLLKSTESS